MRRIRVTLVTALMALLCLAGTAHALTLVRVGGYLFPPYVDILGTAITGKSIALIAAMNQIQNEYRFEFIPTTSPRRYEDLDERRFDIMLFENLAWGWQGRPVEASRVFATGGEVYVARKATGRDQSYFETLHGKCLRGFEGYHYGFAHFNADPASLGFNIGLTTSHERNLRAVLAGQCDIAVVTEAWIKTWVARHPASGRELLVSEKRDQTYAHTVLVRRGGPVTARRIDAILDALEQRAILKKILDE